ncbi:Uncharacterised protein [Mycobacteroides abscessus subsp. abscessus]|nr:Uncharacterised protein [Mycobacteroides abscessus subsp. abscessus]
MAFFSRYGRSHSWWMPPRVRMRSTVPRTQPATAESVTSASGICTPSVCSMACRPMIIARCGAPRYTSETTLPVSSRVRPVRDCRPNSRSMSNRRRRLARSSAARRVLGCTSGFQNPTNCSRSTMSGGSS